MNGALIPRRGDAYRVGGMRALPINLSGYAIAKNGPVCRDGSQSRKISKEIRHVLKQVGTRLAFVVDGMSERSLV